MLNEALQKFLDHLQTKVRAFQQVRPAAQRKQVWSKQILPVRAFFVSSPPIDKSLCCRNSRTQATAGCASTGRYQRVSFFGATGVSIPALLSSGEHAILRACESLRPTGTQLPQSLLGTSAGLRVRLRFSLYLQLHDVAQVQTGLTDSERTCVFAGVGKSYFAALLAVELLLSGQTVIYERIKVTDRYTNSRVEIFKLGGTIFALPFVSQAVGYHCLIDMLAN